MNFNRYVLDLYLESKEGKINLKNWIEFLDWKNWEKTDFTSLTNLINSNLVWPLALEKLNDALKSIKSDVETTTTNHRTDHLIHAKQIWQSITENFRHDHPTQNGKRENIANIDEIAIYLTILNPNFFFPYFYISHFYIIKNLFKEFNLNLPELPPKRDYNARFNYYFELCQIFYYFRQEHNILPHEFFTFLYGFSGNFIKPKLEKNENPLRVWITGGSEDDYKNINSNQRYIWSANTDVQKSDLQLIYFRTPYSGIGAVTTCLSDGFYDPFDYYEGRVVTGNIKTFSFIKLTELKENSILQKNHLVKMNMQGVKDQPLSNQEYQELKNILKNRGEDYSVLPELESVAIDTNINFENENDVERELLEPLLLKLEFNSNDWVRQLPLRMGRGERNYPDYALLVNSTKRHEETARFLWEAKYRIRNQVELRDAFLQAKSYARRLNSDTLGLCSVEGVWVSSKQDDFEFEKILFFKWNDLKKNENWSCLKKHFL